MQIISTTTILRNRGQLTLPSHMRDLLPWLTLNTPITIQASLQDQTITLSPASKTTHTHNWDEMWRKIHLARSFSGQKKVTESATDFLRRDRTSGH